MSISSKWSVSKRAPLCIRCSVQCAEALFNDEMHVLDKSDWVSKTNYKNMLIQLVALSVTV